ncbi:MAG: peptidoglycan DD-metalloendopeptidase family protein [Gammaproteobacteria bacterium]|nr:peptidoglycan DD-metalloendopeptidase family protein [SAR86 cluster bacterium]MDO7676857.1 peptidoglycan DD-metalloendopeptidase family protein [Gammaproteobacteria bacterium]MDO7694498.1 peptidoglycan DD-metalloendopeptidase family protein [Gammaproteobacteria bacterium]MDO7709396.1 peptidoglycan DD-metalloendopeptidase family protein [Gammaproteobacteria bacterium]MDO7750569.1 peptidoglycan DD-metalloendopeptidase family protein [SAR86 cluster bacterium]
MKFSVLYLIVILLLGGCSSLESVTSNFLTKMPQSSKESYVVQSGDSIWSIALQYNLDPETIIEDNNLLKPFTIFPGQKLYFDADSASKAFISSEQIVTWHSPINTNKKPVSQGSYWLMYETEKGNPISSVQEGRVVIAGADIPGYGNLVMISHPNGFLSLYAHCKDIFVKKGDVVSRGAIIANVGSSEASSPMLRFQLRKNGTPVSTSGIKF